MSRLPTVAVIAQEAALEAALCKVLQAAGYVPVDRDRTLGGEVETLGSPILCAIVGLSNANWQDGIETVRSLAASARQIPVIVVGEPGNFEMVLAAMRAGASDFVTRSSRYGDLAASVRTQIERAPAPGTAPGVRLPPEFGTLSDRECEVLDWVVNGYSTKQIAAEIGRVEKTVEYYRNRIMKKLGVSSVVQVVRLATLHRWSWKQAETGNGASNGAAVALASLCPTQPQR